MIKDPVYERLREISWRRKLTAEEEVLLSQWLADHPEAQTEADAEINLTSALSELPNVPVASNFTSRVLEAARRESALAQNAGTRPSWWLRWLPKAAVAAVVLAAGLLSYDHFLKVRREELARSLTEISQISGVPSPDVLKDFDAIAALGQTPPADEELLKVMQ